MYDILRFQRALQPKIFKYDILFFIYLHELKKVILSWLFEILVKTLPTVQPISNIMLQYSK